MIDQAYIDERVEEIKQLFPNIIEIHEFTDDQLQLAVKEAYMVVPKMCIYINKIVDLLAVHILLDNERLNENLDTDNGDTIDDIKSIRVTGDMNITYRDKNSDEVNRLYGGSEFGLRAVELMRKCVKMNIGFITPIC